MKEKTSLNLTENRTLIKEFLNSGYSLWEAREAIRLGLDVENYEIYNSYRMAELHSEWEIGLY